MYTHPTPKGLMYSIKDIPGVGTLYTEPVEDIPIIAALANTGFLDIMLNVNRMCSAGLDKEISQIYQALLDRGWVRL